MGRTRFDKDYMLLVSPINLFAALAAWCVFRKVIRSKMHNTLELHLSRASIQRVGQNRVSNMPKRTPFKHLQFTPFLDTFWCYVPVNKCLYISIRIKECIMAAHLFFVLDKLVWWCHQGNGNNSNLGRSMHYPRYSFQVGFFPSKYRNHEIMHSEESCWKWHF